MSSVVKRLHCYLRPVCVSFRGCRVPGWRCLCDGPFLTHRLSTHNTACCPRQRAKCQRVHRWPPNQIFPLSTQQKQQGPQQQHIECHCLHDKYVSLPCERWAAPEDQWQRWGAATAGGIRKWRVWCPAHCSHTVSDSYIILFSHTLAWQCFYNSIFEIWDGGEHVEPEMWSGSRALKQTGITGFSERCSRTKIKTEISYSLTSSDLTLSCRANLGPLGILAGLHLGNVSPCQRNISTSSRKKKTKRNLAAPSTRHISRSVIASLI